MKNSLYTNVRIYGNNILYIGYDENGERVQKKDRYEPSIYLETSNDHEIAAYSYDGTPLKRILHSNIKSAKDYIRKYSDVRNIKLYGIDKFNYQYISDHFPSEIQYNINQIRVQYFDLEVYSGNGFPDPFKAEEEITCLSIKDTALNEMHVWILKNKFGKNNNFDSKNLKYIEKEDITFKLICHEFLTEADLLEDFLEWFTGNYPDIISGWYIRHFDIPYLINRIRNVLGNREANKLSPWGIIKEQIKRTKRYGVYTENKIYDIYGISELDYMDLYKKYTYTKIPSYSLDYVAKKHLNKGKIKFDGTLHELLMTDYQKYVEYNIIDTERVNQLDTVLNFINLIVEVSYAGKVATYNDSLGTVKYWEILIYNHLVEKGQQPPIKLRADDEKKDQYAGAFVKNPHPAKYKWVMSFDLASLYPSIIRQVNIGPETKISLKSCDEQTKSILKSIKTEKLINKAIDLSHIITKYDYSISGNAKLYDKTKQSFFSELMQKFFDRRKIYKKQALDAKKLYQETKDETHKALSILYNIKQHAYKILINAAYGAIGNPHFQYYDSDNAEAVTITGQVVIQWAERRINQYLNRIMVDKNNKKTIEEKDRVIYIDTDSLFISFDDIVKKICPDEIDTEKVVEFLDKVAKQKIQPLLQSAYDDLFVYLNNKENHMKIERDVISDVAVWQKKKRYFMNVWDAEGVRYSEPQMKVMGLEVVKSSTPEVCRHKLEECLKIILRKDEDTLIKFIKEFRKEFKSLTPEETAFPRGTNEIDKWLLQDGTFKSGIPIHVRGCLNYNQTLEKLNLTKKYDTIKENDSIFFSYLKMPNHLHQNVISFGEELPKEFGLEDFIDYDTQFEKAFIAPLKNITDIINWNTEERNEIDSLFH